MTEDQLIAAMKEDASVVAAHQRFAYGRETGKVHAKDRSAQTPRYGALTFHDGKTVRFTSRGLKLVRRLRSQGMSRSAITNWFGLSHSLFGVSSNHPDLKEVLSK